MKNPTKSIAVYISACQMQYLEIKLLKYIQDLYEENHKLVMNEITEKLNRQRDSSWSWVEMQWCTEPGIYSLIHGFSVVLSKSHVVTW